MNIKILKPLLIAFLAGQTLYGAEIDQLTDREKYQDLAGDFTPILNAYTNSLLLEAVENFNTQYNVPDMTLHEIHRKMAFEIHKSTAGENPESYSGKIPDRINLVYALGKSGHGPVQTWIVSEENRDWWTKLGENIYSGFLPEPVNRNYIVKVAGEFIGPDKIDHFFDQGYSYWLKSGFGEDDKAAIEFGVESENGWYGLKAGGVFSFADLKANWEGYRFYIDLFDEEKGYLKISEEGLISMREPFDWSDYIDWQFDELKNPSVMTEITYQLICRHIKRHYEQYKETYDYLEKKGILDFAVNRDSIYLTDDLAFSRDRVFDLKEIMAGT
ncbi:MAG: hypothetical protein JXR86_11280 [Spirochaetales bacterium]|nr:hypothetical protein [Spirochaetales bacterium]